MKTTEAAEQTMPSMYLTLDDESINRAITAVATEMHWPDIPEGQAAFLVALVWRALEGTLE